jgi:putative transposase
MRCPHCEAADTSERRERTELGYRRFRCQACHREFNERTGTRFNHLQSPTDVVCFVVLWRVRYKLSLCDLPEIFLERGLVFTHEAVREWETQLALLSEMLRKHRRGRIGSSWYTDETYIKVKGRWTYLYRAIDREGNLVDVLLSEKRDKAVAEAFFRSARRVTGSVPERVTTDGHDSSPGASPSRHQTTHPSDGGIQKYRIDQTLLPSPR